jgi:hypothetical protein
MALHFDMKKIVLRIWEYRASILRYGIVRVLSKAGPFAVSYLVFKQWGILETAFITLALLLFFNYAFDFFFQKYWVFKNAIVWSWKMFSEFFWYMVVRLSVSSLVLGTIFFLRFVFDLHLVTAGLITGAIYFPISFLVLRWLFLETGKSIFVRLKELVIRWKNFTS